MLLISNNITHFLYVLHCLQVRRSSVEDDGKDREDAAAKSKAGKDKDKSKSAAVEDTVKVNICPKHYLHWVIKFLHY